MKRIIISHDPQRKSLGALRIKSLYSSSDLFIIRVTLVNDNGEP